MKLATRVALAVLCPLSPQPYPIPNFILILQTALGPVTGSPRPAAADVSPEEALEYMRTTMALINALVNYPDDIVLRQQVW